MSKRYRVLESVSLATTSLGLPGAFRFVKGEEVTLTDDQAEN